jgi:predicted DNA-binding transcriptional regulator AlpA
VTPAILTKETAADYLGIGTTGLDILRKSDPTFPDPVWLDSRARWVRTDLDEWVAKLPRSAISPDKPTPVPVRHRRSKHDR